MLCSFWSCFIMKFLTIILLATVTAHAEQLEGLLDAVPSVLSGFVGDQDSKMLNSKDDDKTSPSKSTGFSKPLSLVSPHAAGFSKPLSLVPPVALGAPIPGSGKFIKIAAAPVKTIAAKKAVAAKVLAGSSLKAAAAVPKKFALKKKPKVHSLKPIVYVIEKPVPVYHKVPVPKKVLVPKFYPVYKKIPVPKIIPVPFKVPVKKIIPKIVKIPKAFPVPKIVLVKKPFPVAIPYPVPKFKKFPVPKPVPYPKFIPIPIPKKVPKFIPVPIKKIIKVPKPYYVPVRVPHFSASYLKTPMAVNVPNIKKPRFGGKFYSGVKKPSMNIPLNMPLNMPKFYNNQGFKLASSGSEEIKGYGEMKGSEEMKSERSFLDESMASLGEEDKELLKLLTGGGMTGDKNIKQ